MSSLENKNTELIQKDRLKGKKLIIPVFVPHMGCPHDCCFCNQRTISGQIEAPGEEDVRNIIDSYREIRDHYGSVEVAFYGGSFTAIPVLQQEMYLKTARDSVGKNIPFRVSTRPDCIDLPTLELLRKYGVTTVELGAQSMCDRVLKASGRGHLAEDTVKASALIKQEGFVLGIQTMLGLPESDEETEFYTARRVIALQPELVRIYPTIVLEGTELADRYLAGKYKAMELETAVAITAKLLPEYERHGITVIRIGLQSSDNIREGGRITAGPYHPAFGELVRSRIAADWICRQLADFTPGTETEEGIFQRNLSFYGNRVKIVFGGDRLNIHVPAKLASQFVGQHRCNIKLIGERYGCRVKVVIGDV